MKKNLVLTVTAALVLTAAFSGCKKNEPAESANSSESTPLAAAANEPVLNVYSEYLLLDGYTAYESPDGGFSLHLPNGSTMNDSDAANITINIASDFAAPDLLNISKTANAQRITSTAELMEMLKNDNSIDITGFYVLKKDGAYEGYKYTYTSVDNADLKGIVSVFFADDGTAYTVNATINNGGDETNVNAINSIVDSFVNNF